MFEHCKPGVANREIIAGFVIGILLEPSCKEAKVAESLKVCETVVEGEPDETVKVTALTD